jgi:hypothetical protein
VKEWEISETNTPHTSGDQHEPRDDQPAAVVETDSANHDTEIPR